MIPPSAMKVPIELTRLVTIKINNNLSTLFLRHILNDETSSDKLSKSLACGGCFIPSVNAAKIPTARNGDKVPMGAVTSVTRLV